MFFLEILSYPLLHILPGDLQGEHISLHPNQGSVSRPGTGWGKLNNAEVLPIA